MITSHKSESSIKALFFLKKLQDSLMTSFSFDGFWFHTEKNISINPEETIIWLRWETKKAERFSLKLMKSTNLNRKPVPHLLTNQKEEKIIFAAVKADDIKTKTF